MNKFIRKRRLFLYILLSIICSMIFLINCGGSGNGGDHLKLSSGTWAGDIIQFNVSVDGSSITTKGSSLKDGVSILLGPILYQNIGNCTSYTTSYYLKTDDIVVNDKVFSYASTNDTIQISGNFTSSKNSKGTYSINDYNFFCQGSEKASGLWNASPASSPSSGSSIVLSLSQSLPYHIEYHYEYDHITGDLRTIIEYKFYK